MSDTRVKPPCLKVGRTVSKERKECHVRFVCVCVRGGKGDREVDGCAKDNSG